MKYKHILKYNYSYIISGNYYKEETRQYYQLFENINQHKILSLNSVADKLVTIEKLKDEEIVFSYHYSKYLHPNTFNSDSEQIKKTYTLKKQEKISIDCIEKYWSYAKGAENGPATLKVEWISYEDMLEECYKMAKDDKYQAVKFSNFLIDEGQYSQAFELLDNTNMESYELGLCYEKGYGTNIDLKKALEIYLNVGNSDCYQGIERIHRLDGKNIKFDKVKETIIYDQTGQYKKALLNAIIPTEFSDNSLEDLRRNVELHILKFLEIGRPSNDPFGHPTHDMHHLALYYDMINQVPLDKQKRYYYIETEDDIYDGGTRDYHIIDNKLIIETLQEEALKNDVIAIGCLVVQFSLESSYKLDNIKELINKLEIIANNESKNNRSMANYFLGLYYEAFAKKILRNNSSDESNIKLAHENEIIAYNYFEKALKDDLYLAISHLAKKYFNEDPSSCIDKLEKYIDYIPSQLSSYTADFYEILGISYFYYKNDYLKAKEYIDLPKYRLEFEKVLCAILECIKNNQEINSITFDKVWSFKEPFIKTPQTKYLYCIIAYSASYQIKYLGKYNSQKSKLIDLEKEEEKNFEYMKQAAEDGYIPAYRRLASWYKEGFGTKVDLVLANMWMNKYITAIKNDPTTKYSILGPLFDNDDTYSNNKIYSTLKR